MIDAARRGEESAWAEIYDRYAPGLLGYLRTRGAPDPEDVLGEVFLQLVRDLGRFKGGERDFRAWAFVVAHHRLLDATRRLRRRPEESPIENLDQTKIVAGADEEAMARLGSERALALVKRLTPDQQSVILLRIFGDLSIEDVARALKKPTGAVKALQRRALKALRKEFSREGVSQ